VGSFAQIQIADVPRQGGLADFEPTLAQESLKVLLTGDCPVLEHFQDSPLTECFIHDE
jgi:hypothetical protein